MLHVLFLSFEANKSVMKLTFDEIGNGKPIVLLHAFPLSGKMWKSQAELLAKNGFRVILPDLPGFGTNNKSAHRYSIEEMASQISQLLKSINIDKAIVGGLSMGGYVLFNLCRLTPEKLSALVFCDTTYTADTEEKRNSRFDLISKIKKQGSSALIENMLPNLISDDTKQNNPPLNRELEEFLSEVNPGSAINAMKSMAERKDTSDIIDKISVPTLLIFGEFDKVTTLEIARKMNRTIPGSELEIIKKAGHFSNLEQPEQFNKALLNFCNRIKF
jgi:3-oxoadipate enol-lactonase